MHWAGSVLTRCFLPEGSAWVARWLHVIGTRSELRADSATFLIGTAFGVFSAVAFSARRGFP